MGFAGHAGGRGSRKRGEISPLGTRQGTTPPKRTGPWGCRDGEQGLPRECPPWNWLACPAFFFQGQGVAVVRKSERLKWAGDPRGHRARPGPSFAFQGGKRGMPSVRPARTIKHGTALYRPRLQPFTGPKSLPPSGQGQRRGPGPGTRSIGADGAARTPPLEVKFLDRRKTT